MFPVLEEPNLSRKDRHAEHIRYDKMFKQGDPLRNSRALEEREVNESGTSQENIPRGRPLAVALINYCGKPRLHQLEHTWIFFFPFTNCSENIKERKYIKIEPLDILWGNWSL